jgi:PD-(D/E)XK nuclease superfamily
VDAPARTKPIAPSKLFLLLGCKLRYLLETESNSFDQLPGTVSLFIGRAVHSAIYAASVGEIAHRHDVIRNYLISQLLAFAKGSKAILLVLNSINLELTESSIVSAARLMDAVRTAFDLSEKRREFGSTAGYLAEADESFSADQQQARQVLSRRDAMDKIFGSEVRLISAKLDVAGQADKIERLTDTTIRIADFKTGAAADELGQLRRDYQLQIRCYALILRDLFPKEKIILRIVAADGVWDEEFTTESSHELEETLKSAQATVPLHLRMDFEKLAEPGRGCVQCRFRPSCPAYRAWAPDQWSNGQGNLPLDTWGTVESVERRSANLIDFRILDSAGRHVRILAVPERMFLKLPSIGACLELYELNSLETGGRGKYPRNFYVVNAIRPYASAFSALVRTT